MINNETLRTRGFPSEALKSIRMTDLTSTADCTLIFNGARVVAVHTASDYLFPSDVSTPVLFSRLTLVSLGELYLRTTHLAKSQYEVAKRD